MSCCTIGKRRRTRPGLDVFDWAVDQNYRRLSGLEFDPFFHRFLPADEEGHVRLEGETFVDVVLGRN